MDETYEKIRREVLERVENICKAAIYSMNTIAAISGYALSVFNYYVEVIQLEHEDYFISNENVRKILNKH